jgi:hypothetical protein
MPQIKEVPEDGLSKSQNDIRIEPITKLTTQAGTSILEVPNIHNKTKVSKRLKAPRLGNRRSHT